MEFTPTDFYRVIVQTPSITPPVLCLVIGEHVWPQPSFAGVSTNDEPITDEQIVSNLLEEHPESWLKTCDIVDQLLAEGAIYMNDDGEMRVPGM